MLNCENSLSMLDEICRVVKQQERLDELYEILAEVEEALRIEVSKMESLELWSDSYPDLVKYLKQ